MRLYLITNRRLFAGTPEQSSQAFWDNLANWERAGLDFIQVREKDMHSSDLEQMTDRLQQSLDSLAVTRGTPPPRVLLNVGNQQQVQQICAASRVADGVHLPGGPQPLADRVREARAIWKAERPEAPEPVVSVSCHTVGDVEQARAARVSVILFAPVFEKPIWEDLSPEQRRQEVEPSFGAARLEATLPGTGLAALQAACTAAGPVPVFALGGVTLANAGECMEAGAAGIAGIRLFAGEGWREVIKWRAELGEL